MPRGSVCLTGDVHNRSPRSREQRLLAGSEVDALADYLAIAHEYGVRPTIFVSGLAAREERSRLRELVEGYRPCIGGHWSNAFPWMLPYQVFGKITGLRRGPAWWQTRDITRTSDAIEASTGVRIAAWRDHAYRCDRNTARSLGGRGIRILSDEVNLAANGPAIREGVVSLPINVLPDHESIAHLLGERAGERGRLTPAQWRAEAERQIASIVAAGGVATVLAHPACMRTADGFAAFRDLCRTLAGYRTATVEEIAAEWTAAPERRTA